MSMFDASRDARSRLGAMGMGAGGMPSLDEGKQPMGAVNYRMADTPESACGSCAHFQAPDACEIVAGRVTPDGVCDLWEPVAGPQSPAPTDVEAQLPPL